MKVDVTYYYNYDFKYRLLICLLNNYYTNKIKYNNDNFKVLFVGDWKLKLVSQYDKIFKTIESFTPQDLYTIKEFNDNNYKNLTQVFNDLKDRNYSFNKIIKDIKRIYSKRNSIFYSEPCYNTTKLSKEISSMFIIDDKIDHIYEKLSVKDVFILDDILTIDEIKKRFGLLRGLISVLKMNQKVLYYTKNLFNLDINNTINIYFSSDYEVRNYIDKYMIDYIKSFPGDD